MPDTSYLLALGSNQRHALYGRPDLVINEAITKLSKSGLSIEATSETIKSRAIGPSSRSYDNAALIAKTTLQPLELLRMLKHIESQFGRRRGQKWSRRVLDLDIILWSEGPFVTADGELAIPHNAMRERDFVLGPAAEIAPDWRDPISGLTIRHLLWRLNRAKPLDPKQKRH